MIQEEKETAELRAEELESRVAIDTLPANWRPEIVYDRSSPPLSGRSTPSPRPSLQSHDYIHKYHTLNSAVSRLLHTSLLPGSLCVSVLRNLN